MLCCALKRCMRENNCPLYGGNSEHYIFEGRNSKLCGVVAGVYCALIGGIVAWENWKERKELKEIQKANQEEYEI